MSTTPLRYAPSSSAQSGSVRSSRHPWDTGYRSHQPPAAEQDLSAGRSATLRYDAARSAPRFRSVSPSVHFSSARPFHISSDANTGLKTNIVASPSSQHDTSKDAGTSSRRKRDRTEISTTPSRKTEQTSSGGERSSWMLSALRRLPLLGSLVASSSASETKQESTLPESVEASPAPCHTAPVAGLTADGVEIQHNASPCFTTNVRGPCNANTSPSSSRRPSSADRTACYSSALHSGHSAKDTGWSLSAQYDGQHETAGVPGSLNGNDIAALSARSRLHERRILSQLPVYANSTEEEKDLAHILQMRRRYGLGPLTMTTSNELLTSCSPAGDQPIIYSDDAVRGKRQRLATQKLNLFSAQTETLWDPFSTLAPIITHPADQRCSSQWQFGGGVQADNTVLTSSFGYGGQNNRRVLALSSSRATSKRRGLRATDYRRLLRQAKFQPCHWIDYFDYVKAKDADKEDQRFFFKPLEKRDAEKSEPVSRVVPYANTDQVDMSKKIVEKDAVTSTVSPSSPPPLEQPKSAALSGAEENTAKVLKNVAPSIADATASRSDKEQLVDASEKPVLDKKNQPPASSTAESKASQPIPWWEANLNKPVEVSVEDDGVFAENAGDEPETAKTDLTQTASNAVVPAKNDAKPSLFSVNFETPKPPAAASAAAGSSLFVFSSTSSESTFKQAGESAAPSIKVTPPLFDSAAALPCEEKPRTQPSLFDANTTPASTSQPASSKPRKYSLRPKIFRPNVTEKNVVFCDVPPEGQETPPSLNLFSAAPPTSSTIGSKIASESLFMGNSSAPSTEKKENATASFTALPSAAPSLPTPTPKSSLPAVTQTRSTIVPPASNLFGTFTSSSLFGPSNASTASSTFSPSTTATTETTTSTLASSALVSPIASSASTVPVASSIGTSPFSSFSSFQPSSGSSLFSSQPNPPVSSLFGAGPSGVGSESANASGGLSQKSPQSSGVMSLFSQNAPAINANTSAPFTFGSSLFGVSSQPTSLFGNTPSASAPPLGATSPASEIGGKRAATTPSLFGGETTSMSQQPFGPGVGGSSAPTPFTFGAVTTPSNQDMSSSSNVLGGTPVAVNPFAANAGTFAGSAPRRPKIRLKRTMH